MHAFQIGTTVGWPVPLEGITVNGNRVAVSANHTGAVQYPYPNNSTQNSTGSSGEAVSAFISTRGSNVVAPPEAVAAIYANIPGAEELPSGSESYSSAWIVPCNSTIDMRFTIGGHEYPIQTSDVVFGQLPSRPGMCMGSIFA